MTAVFRKRPPGNTAPGPNGIPTKVLRCIPDENLEQIRKVFTRCLKEGNFPEKWKLAKLVIIPKGGNKPDGTPKTRPICLINNIA